jgi:hypothetical protein
MDTSLMGIYFDGYNADNYVNSPDMFGHLKFIYEKQEKFFSFRKHKLKLVYSIEQNCNPKTGGVFPAYYKNVLYSHQIPKIKTFCEAKWGKPWLLGEYAIEDDGCSIYFRSEQAMLYFKMAFILP